MISNREILPLTGIRGIAAIWVLLYHIFPYSNYNLLTALTSTGYLGVDLFFILSGFILAYTYSHMSKGMNLLDYLKFMQARFARIYPLHFMALMAVFMVVLILRSIDLLYESEKYSADGLMQNILMITSWQIPVNASWNDPAWSISAEFLAYLLFPILIKLLNINREIYLISICITLLLLVNILCGLIYFPASNMYGLVRIILEFPAGILLFKIYSIRTPKNRNYSRIAWIFLLSSVLISLIFRNNYGFEGVPFLAAAIYAFSRSKDVILSSKVLNYLGRISYSLYITHFIVIIPVISLYRNEMLQVRDYRFIIISLILILLVGIFGYQLIEEPARKVIRRRK